MEPTPVPAPTRTTPDHPTTGGRASARPESDDAAQDIDAEQATLAAAIAKPDAYDAAAKLVNAAAFYHPAHQAIWHAVADLHGLRQPVTRITVADRLRATAGDRELEPALRLLPSLEDRPWTMAAVVWHARIVARAATRRAAWEAAGRLAQATHLHQPQEFRDELADAIDRLTVLARAWDSAEAQP